ncbi:MmgE/PrpD family protein [Baekduia soli]|uniref:MmgE/PrpD family protein n=1 Tax=Baekduia soli TaxID=496014 RepID=A0A5B8TZH4_9ACTN|nr:MmgE/PrpD family protein [Baekduia soli]QEC46123.1 MmgE/PrpD family protein [Baekduia soli]
MSAPVAEQLAAFADAVRRDGLDDTRAARMTGHIRDIVGICIAAGAEWGDDPVTRVVGGWGGPGAAGAVGRALRAPAPHAALVTGTLAHAIDFDDTHLPSVLHPSASVVPAALAAGEAAGAEGALLLAAVAVGDEVCCRLGMAGYDAALKNSIFFEHGLHATAICGAVGAAAAAALVTGLDAEQVAHAMSIATSMGAGILEANRTGGMVKRVHCGWAAHAGVAAAELAAAGLTGAPTAFEGRFGFLHAYCREAADVDAVTDGLRERWEIDTLHVKPYPSNHFTHAVIDAALMAREAGIAPGDVLGVQVGLAGPVLRTVAEPPEVKAAPPTGYAAKFSAPFTFALALLGGGGLGLSLGDFTDERAADPALRALAGRVRCVRDDRCDAIFPHHFPAVVTITTASGEHELAVLENRGSPQRPLDAAELSLKFRDCAGGVLPAAQVDELDAVLADLAGLQDLGTIARLASPA